MTFATQTAPPDRTAIHARSSAAPRRTKVIRARSFSLRGLTGDLAALAEYFDLLVTLTAHRIKVRYKQSVLGIAWAFVQPLALMLIYTVIFSLVARVPTDGGVPYPVFAYTALLPWTTFSTALANATTGVTSNSQLVTKVYFPREILPLSYVFTALVDFAIASIILAGLLVWYQIPLTATALFAVPIIVVMMLFVSAASLLLSVLQVRFRDIGVGMPLLLQLWMFATPVIYPLSAVMNSPKLPGWFKTLYNLNPMVGVIENFRRVVLQGVPPDFTSLGLAAGVSLVLLPLAYIYFKRTEATMADVI